MNKGRPHATRIRDVDSGQEKDFPALLRYPQWSADGRQLFGNSPTSRSSYFGPVENCSAESGDCRELVPWGAKVMLSESGTQVCFLDWISSTARSLWRVAPRGGPGAKVAELRGLDPIGDFYSVGPDGRIVCVEFAAGRRELRLADLTSSR